MPNHDGPDHPRGTLFIVAAYAAVFVIGWLLLFAGVFLPRSAP